MYCSIFIPKESSSVIRNTHIYQYDYDTFQCAAGEESDPNDSVWTQI